MDVKILNIERGTTPHKEFYEFLRHLMGLLEREDSSTKYIFVPVEGDGCGRISEIGKDKNLVVMVGEQELQLPINDLIKYIFEKSYGNSQISLDNTQIAW